MPFPSPARRRGPAAGLPPSRQGPRRARHLSALDVLILAAAAAALLALARPASAVPPDMGPPRLGVQVQSMTRELRAYFKVPDDVGVLVARVEPDSPAAEAGIEVGDVIVEAGGEPVESPRDLIWQALRAPEGEKLKIALLRKGERKELEVVPRGEAHPPIWERPDLWGPGQGGNFLRDIREQLRNLEKRLEKLEQKMDDNAQRT